jgi:hypothetical protein
VVAALDAAALGAALSETYSASAAASTAGDSDDDLAGGSKGSGSDDAGGGCRAGDLDAADASSDDEQGGGGAAGDDSRPWTAEGRQLDVVCGRALLALALSNLPSVQAEEATTPSSASSSTRSPPVKGLGKGAEAARRAAILAVAARNGSLSATAPSPPTAVAPGGGDSGSGSKSGGGSSPLAADPASRGVARRALEAAHRRNPVVLRLLARPDTFAPALDAFVALRGSMGDGPAAVDGPAKASRASATLAAPAARAPTCPAVSGAGTWLEIAEALAYAAREGPVWAWAGLAVGVHGVAGVDGSNGTSVGARAAVAAAIDGTSGSTPGAAALESFLRGMPPLPCLAVGPFPDSAFPIATRMAACWGKSLELSA